MRGINSVVLLVGLSSVARAAAMLTPPAASMGAMGLTPSGLAKVQAANSQIALTHLQDCGAGPSCVGKTNLPGNNFQTVSNFLLSVCNAAGLCGGFIVQATAHAQSFVGPAGGGACGQLTTTSGNPEAGPYVSNIDGQTYQDPNSPQGSSWYIATVGFCSGNLNGFQDAPDPTAAAQGTARVYRRNFSYNATDCSQISGGDFSVLGALTHPIAGRMSRVQRIRQQNKCGGKIVSEVYAETAYPPGYQTVSTPLISTGTAGYGLASQDGSLITANLQSPASGGMNGVSWATAAPVASAGYPEGQPPIPPNYPTNRTAQNAAAVGYLTGGVTLDEGDYYWTGEGSPAKKTDLIAAASTTTAPGGGTVQSISGVVTVDGVVQVAGTVALADGVLPSGGDVPMVRARRYTFASEYQRVMVKHSTAPLLGLVQKFTTLEASLSTAALQTQYCFSLADWGSHCVDLGASGYLTALALMRFFIIGGAFIGGVMYLLGG